MSKINDENTDNILKILDNLPLLYRNIDIINKNNFFYFIPIENSHIGGMISGKIHDFFLGELLQLWNPDNPKNYPLENKMSILQ